MIYTDGWHESLPVGGFLFRFFGLSAGGGFLGSIFVATIGAIVLIVLLRIIKKA